MPHRKEAKGGEQPGLERSLLKLHKKTHQLLKWVAAFRHLSLQECVHVLLIEEMGRKKEAWQAEMEQIAATAPQDSDEG